MPTTTALKGIPEDVYVQLKRSADANRRSLNSEAIACLETVLLPKKTSALEHVVAARATRSALKQGAFKPADIERFKRAGRP